MALSEQAKQARREYYREYYRRNANKLQERNNQYWERRAADALRKVQEMEEHEEGEDSEECTDQ